jgi:hypothetical protein
VGEELRLAKAEESAAAAAAAMMMTIDIDGERDKRQ